MGIVAALIGAAVASTPALGGAFIGSLGFFGSFLARAAIGIALNALAPKPKTPNFAGNTARQGYTVNQRGSALEHQIIYGTMRTGGVVVFDGTTGTNNKFLHRVIAFTGHEIEDFDEIYINDEVATLDSNGNVTSPSRYNGFVRIKKKFGTDDQAADSDLVSEVDEWTTDHRLRGVSYLYVRFEFDQDVFPNGVPEVTAVVKGKKVFDPRTNTTAFSDNPALCLRDYILAGYGLGEELANIDDSLVIAAANVCDETDTIAGTKRYTCNGAFTTGITPYDLLQDMLTSMGGLLWYAQGQWRMKPAYYVAPTISFDEDDLRSSIAVQTRHSRRDNFNTVRGTFRGPETDYQITDYPEVSNAAFISADGGQESVADIELPFTDSSVTARRIALIALERNRQQLTVSASFGLRAFQVQVGDIVQLSVDRFGWTNKEFEVSSWTFGLTDDQDLQVQMILREISESVFDEVDDGVVYERDNTTLPSPFITVAPQNLVVSDGGFTTDDGTFVNSFIVDWDAPDDAFVDFYVLEWRVQGDSKFKSVQLDSTEFQISPVIGSTVYEIRVKAVNTLGVSGPYASTTFQVGGDQSAPGPVTSLAAVGAYQTITISYVPPADADWYKVNVYESLDSNFVNSSVIGSSTTDVFYRLNLPNDITRFYWVETVDYSGNEGSIVGPVSATTQLIEENDFSQALQDTLERAGVDAVNTLPASGDFDGQLVFLLSENRLYRWVESTSSWSTELFTAIEDDSVTTTKISDDAVSTPKLQALAVEANKIASGAIVTDKLAAGAVVSNKIAAGAVTADKISVNELSAVAANIGTFQSSLTGERVRITDDVIEVFDASNQIRVKIGNLNA
jgi:predicted phage tail protein